MKLPVPLKSIRDRSRILSTLSRKDLILTVEPAGSTSSSPRYWICAPSPSGPVPVREVCGGLYRDATGNTRVCLLPAGWGTGREVGKCKSHSRSEALLDPLLSRAEGLPARLRDLLEFNAGMKKDFENLDRELLILESLRDYLLTSAGTEGELSLEVIDRVNTLILSSARLKAIRSKLSREMKLDSSSVKSFVQSIFGVLQTRLDPDTSKRLMQEILNDVIVPFRARSRFKESSSINLLNEGE